MLQAIPYSLPYFANRCPARLHVVRLLTTHLDEGLPLRVGSSDWLLGGDAGVVPGIGGPMRPTGRGVVIARMGPSGFPAFLVDHLFAFADAFDMRGSFLLSHMRSPFLAHLARGFTRG